MEALNKLLKKRTTLVFIDLEGTQFSHEITAIGCCKVHCDENGNIISEPTCYKRYVKCYGQIGRIVTSMTSIDNNTLKYNGITFEEMLNELNHFINEELSSCAFLVFGSNDVKMFIESIKYSQPNNESIALEICNHTIDFLAFISQFIRDKNGNNYSLVNYLKVYNILPNGQSHDPLNDSIDLMNLYKAFLNDTEIKKREYLQILKKQKIFPQPIKKVLTKLINKENVSFEEFDKEIDKYLE